MSTTIFILAVCLVLYFFLKPKNVTHADEYKQRAQTSNRKLKKIASLAKRSSLDQAISGLQRYGEMALRHLVQAHSLGMTPDSARRHALAQLQKEGVCGAFIVDIEVDLYVAIEHDRIEAWSISSPNKEFNRLSAFLQQQQQNVFALGCDLREQTTSGGSVSHFLYPDAFKQSRLNDISAGAPIHADNYSVSDELKINVKYGEIKKAKIPFAIFIYSDLDGVALFEQSELLPPEQEYSRLFLNVIPLTALNSLYAETDEFIDLIDKNVIYNN